MSAITSNLASILLPSYTSPSTHGPSCNCSSCSSKSSSSSRNASANAQGAGSSNNSNQATSASAPLDAEGKPLTKGQQDDVAQLKKTDAAVRRHEQAHLSAAGAYARSGIVLNFKVGPDGKQYAVAGHVDIDTSPVKGNPAATVAKMLTVQRAALAPADPSSQDVAVAAQAGQKASQARAQEAQQQQAGGSGGVGASAATEASGASNPSNVAGGDVSSKSAGAGLKLSISAKYGKTSSGASADTGQLLNVLG